MARMRTRAHKTPQGAVAPATRVSAAAKEEAPENPRRARQRLELPSGNDGMRRLDLLPVCQMCTAGMRRIKGQNGSNRTDCLLGRQMPQIRYSKLAAHAQCSCSSIRRTGASAAAAADTAPRKQICCKHAIRDLAGLNAAVGMMHDAAQPQAFTQRATSGRSSGICPTQSCVGIGNSR